MESSSSYYSLSSSAFLIFWKRHLFLLTVFVFLAMVANNDNNNNNRRSIVVVDAFRSPPPKFATTTATTRGDNKNIQAEPTSDNPSLGILCGDGSRSRRSRRVRCNYHRERRITTTAFGEQQWKGNPLVISSSSRLFSSSTSDDDNKSVKKKKRSKKKGTSKAKTKSKSKSKTIARKRRPNLKSIKQTHKTTTNAKSEQKKRSGENNDNDDGDIVTSGGGSGSRKVKTGGVHNGGVVEGSSSIEDNVVYTGPNVEIPDALFQFDMGPGTIIETEEELELKRRMEEELEINDPKKTGRKKYPKWLCKDYGTLLDDEVDDLVEYENDDDPNAIDADTLGQYDITDLNTKFDYEWDPNDDGDEDPNLLETQKRNAVSGPDSERYVVETEKDEDGIEVGYDPLFGPSNPIDERTKIGTVDSYVIDVHTRNENMLTPEFLPSDLEIAYNEDFVRYRKSLDIIETYQDEFLPRNMPVPCNVAKWYGYPEQTTLPRQNYTNNRFTKLDDLTNFDELTPFRARQKAVELARSNNAEWMPDGVSQAWHEDQRLPYEKIGTLVGTLRKGDCDPEIAEAIQPALRVLGSCADLLSTIETEKGTVFRFHYHGQIKNRYGMSCWTETLLRDCGVEVSGVVFETGFRARDPKYDGGFAYQGWE